MIAKPSHSKIHGFPPSQESMPLSLFLFVVGSLTTFDFLLIGRVTIAEVLAFCAVPILGLDSRIRVNNQNFRKCILVLMLIILGVALGDAVNETPLLLSLKSIARPIFIFGFMLFFITVFRLSPHSFPYFVYGLIVAGLISYMRPSEFEAEATVFLDTYEGIVFRVQPLIGATAISIAVFFYRRKRIVSVLSCLSASLLIAGLGGSRSGVFIWLVTGLIIMGIIMIKIPTIGQPLLTRGKLIFLCLVVLLSTTISYYAYIYAAPRGLLGELHEKKIEEQAKTVFGNSPLGLILAGRAPVYGAVLGIMERPLFGFGSWRGDLTSVYVIEAIESVGTDPETIDRMRRTGFAGGAGHSVLLQAWVENGIIPATGYLLIFLIILKVFFHSIRLNTPMTPYLIYAVVAFSWEFLFSPASVQMRYNLGLCMAYYTVFMGGSRIFAPLRRHFRLDA